MKNKHLILKWLGLSYGVFGLLMGTLLGYLSLGFMGLLIGACVGGIAALVIHYFVLHEGKESHS